MQHLLFEFVIRAALIAAGTAVVLCALRVKMAAARHAAWTGVLACMLLLPVWAAWGPTARLRVLPAIAAPAASQWAGLQDRGHAAQALSEVTLAGLAAPPARQPVWNWRMLLAGIYLLGVGVLLARLAVGTVRAHIVVTRAVNRWGRLTSDVCAAPVTVGWLKPAVLLPATWRAWPQAQLDAVVTHEGEHARRRDPLVQWLALLNRAVFWFHPLAWWLESKLSALAEEACDAAVLARGHDPLEYSEYLLEMARAVLRTGARVKVLGMAMPGSFLPRRIRRILEGRTEQPISRVRMVSLGVACAMVSAAFATGVVDRRMPAQQTAAPLVTAQAGPKIPPAPVDLPFDRPPKRPERPALIAQAQAAAVPAPTPAPQDQKYKDRRMLVLYFDLRAMPAADRSHAFAAAENFVRTKMQANDLLAIITENTGVKVMQDFTGDRNQLLRTLDQVMADPAPDNGAEVDVDRQLISLHTAVNMLASLDGKKAVIYFTAPIGQRTESAELQPLIDAAIRANVAFYTVDAQGLVEALRPEAKQVDEALEKLRELAKRQRELADQQKNAQQPITEERRKGEEGQRWQYEMLRREAEQLQQEAAAGKAYIIGAEDVLEIGVVQQPGVSGAYTVRPDGIISVPLVGNIRATGLTTSQLEAVIADRLRANEILTDPSVTVGVAAVHQRQ